MLEIESLENIGQQDRFKKIDVLKAEIDLLRPLNAEQERRIMQKFRLDWNYHSNALEGNSVDYGETVAFLMNGVTAKGKPFKDYLDIRGHDKAISFLLEIIRGDDYLTEKDIRSLHEIMLDEPYETQVQGENGLLFMKKINLGQYKKFPNHVITQTGKTHYYASPEETPVLMHNLVSWYNENIKNDKIHPAVLAAVFHHRFVAIHPFDDGNGRMTRLLMNLILLKKGFVPVVIKTNTKSDYYLCLSEADSGNIVPFVDYIAENLEDSLELYLRGSRGESIEESSNLDKKLILFKKELEGRSDKIEIKRSLEAKHNVKDHSIVPFFNALALKVEKFKDFFFEYQDCKVSYEDVNVSSEKWNYMQGIDLVQAIDNFPNISGYESFIAALQLKKFKVETRPFSIEIKVAIEFQEYSYLISYDISNTYEFQDFRNSLAIQWLGGYSIRKYYHQKIDKEEISSLVDTIGDELYNRLQNNYKNEDFYSVNLDENTVDKLWLEYKNSESIYSHFLKNLSPTQGVSASLNKIFLYFSVVDYNSIVNDIEQIEYEFSQFVFNKMGLQSKVFTQIRVR